MLYDRAHAVRRWIRPPFSARATTLAPARAVGGAIPLHELERMWEASDRCHRAVCLATGLELRRLEIALGARRVTVAPPQMADSDSRTIRPIDLTIVVGADGRVQAGGRCVQSVHSFSLLEHGPYCPLGRCLHVHRRAVHWMGGVWVLSRVSPHGREMASYGLGMVLRPFDVVLYDESGMEGGIRCGS